MYFYDNYSTKNNYTSNDITTTIQVKACNILRGEYTFSSAEYDRFEPYTPTKVSVSKYDPFSRENIVIKP